MHVCVCVCIRVSVPYMTSLFLGLTYNSFFLNWGATPFCSKPLTRNH